MQIDTPGGTVTLPDSGCPPQDQVWQVLNKTIPSQQGHKAVLNITLKWGPPVDKGDNYFSATAEVFEIVNGRKQLYSCGCLHNEIAQFAPELAHVLVFHLWSAKGPLHYFENTHFWADKLADCDEASPQFAQVAKSVASAACWPDMPMEIMMLHPHALNRQLTNRLPALMVQFKAMIESFGFVY